QSLGLFGRWWAMVRAVCFEPRATYEAVSTNENVASGLGFAVMSSSIGGVFQGIYSALISFLFASFIAAFAKSAGPSMGPLAAIYTGMGFAQIIITPIQAAFMALVVPFIAAGVFHLVLTVFSGATKSYASTYRIVAFGDAAAVFLAIPGLG